MSRIDFMKFVSGRVFGRVTKSIVELARQNFKKVCGQKEMSESLRWQTFRERMRDNIEKIHTPEEAISYCQKDAGFDHRHAVSPETLRLYSRMLASEFGHFYHQFDKLAESPYSLPTPLFRYKKRLVSNVFFFHLRCILFCLTHVKEPRSICEIGGGYGSVARLWLENPVHNPDIYTLVDFPESLFFAEVFLRMNVKNLKLLYAADSAVINQSTLKPRTVILCPITNVAALSGLPLDLVINTNSMQEMPEDWVDFWMDWLKRQDCRFFYSLNYFAQPLQYMAEAANTWSPRLPQEWIIRLQRFDPPFVKWQGTRRIAEILAEKSECNFVALENFIARYELTKSRYLDGQTLLECMDIVRLYPKEDIVWDLLMRCYSEMKPLPKESYWLADYLNSNASSEFKAKHGTRLQKVWSDLQSIRARGREDEFHEIRT